MHFCAFSLFFSILHCRLRCSDQPLLQYCHDQYSANAIVESVRTTEHQCHKTGGHQLKKRKTLILLGHFPTLLLLDSLSAHRYGSVHLYILRMCLTWLWSKTLCGAGQKSVKHLNFRVENSRVFKAIVQFFEVPLLQHQNPSKQN
jgi:hypothetical protein